MNAKSRYLAVFLLGMTVLSMVHNFAMGQGLFARHDIDSAFAGACSVSSCDLDGDNDLDIIAAGNAGSQIVWWRNDNGNPIAFSKLPIDLSAYGIIFVDAADVDDDGDMDVLGASWQGNEVAIWLNGGGNPLTWEKVAVDQNTIQAHEVHAAYVDTDSLLDLIVASGGSHEIMWYRNAGSNPAIWEKNVVDGQFTGARSVVSVDVNGDGHNDLVGAALTANQVSVWYNSGTNPIQWTKQIVDNTFGGGHWVHVCDLDRDNDLDILGAGAIPGSIAWWRNNGGNPIQWTRQVLSNSFAGALSIAAADLDLDNDVDVFGAATYANSVTWWRNDGGTPIQWGANNIATSFMGAWPVFGVDLDKDGDIDILTAASTANRVCWFENTTITTGVEGTTAGVLDKVLLCQNYPNPFNPSTRIQYETNESGFVSLVIYDLLGSEIARLVDAKQGAGEHEVTFDATGLRSGVYFYRLRTGNRVETKKMVLIK